MSSAAFHPEHGWRTLWTSPILENSDLILAREQASLAFEVAKLGYDIVRDGNSFRIRNFPPELETWWSSRSNMIHTKMIDGGFDAEDNFARKKIAWNSRTAGEKPQTAGLLSELRESLPVGSRRSLEDIVAYSHLASREREVLATDEATIQMARRELKTAIDSNQVVPAPRAEIDVLRALPGLATKETFRAAADSFAGARFSFGRHQYFACEHVLQIRTTLPVPGDIHTQSAPVRSALPHDRAVTHLVSACPHGITVCEAPNPGKFAEEVVAQSKELTDQRLVVVDASQATTKDLGALITAPRATTESLILVTGRPRRDYCSVATALAEPTLPGQSLPCISVRERGTSINPKDENDPLDCNVRKIDEKDLFAAVLDLGPEVVVVTQTAALAKFINEVRHSSAIRDNPTTQVPWFSTVTRQELKLDEDAYAYLHQDRHPGFKKGSIARVSITDHRLGLTNPISGEKDRVESWEESHVCTLLKPQNIDLAPGEPIFAHTVKSIPDSPYGPGEIESSGLNPPATECKFWSLGYAAPVASLPETSLNRTVVFIDEGKYTSEKDHEALQYHLHNSASAPIVIKLVATDAIPVRPPPSVPPPFLPATQPIPEDVVGPTLDL